jgi:hypothetical protein
MSLGHTQQALGRCRASDFLGEQRELDCPAKPAAWTWIQQHLTRGGEHQPIGHSFFIF